MRKLRINEMEEKGKSERLVVARARPGNDASMAGLYTPAMAKIFLTFEKRKIINSAEKQVIIKCTAKKTSRTVFDLSL